MPSVFVSEHPGISYVSSQTHPQSISRIRFSDFFTCVLATGLSIKPSFVGLLLCLPVSFCLSMPLRKEIQTTAEGHSRFQGQEILPTPERPHKHCGSHSLVLNGKWVSFPPIKRPRREADHVSPYSVEVKNEYSRISYPPRAFMTLTLTTLHCLQKLDTRQFYTSLSTRSKEAIIKSGRSTERCAERLKLTQLSAHNLSQLQDIHRVGKLFGRPSYREAKHSLRT